MCLVLKCDLLDYHSCRTQNEARSDGLQPCLRSKGATTSLRLEVQDSIRNRIGGELANQCSHECGTTDCHPDFRGIIVAAAPEAPAPVTVESTDPSPSDNSIVDGWKEDAWVYQHFKIRE